MAGTEPVELVGERRHTAQQIASSTQEFGSERSEFDSARPAGPIEDPFANRSFERSDLLADRRLRVPEPVGGPCERSFGRDRVERKQVAQIEIPEPRHEHQYI